jgi:hypothetical protein
MDGAVIHYSLFAVRAFVRWLRSMTAGWSVRPVIHGSSSQTRTSRGVNVHAVNGGQKPMDGAVIHYSLFAVRAFVR